MHETLVHLKQECDYNECMYKKLSSNAENTGMTKRSQGVYLGPTVQFSVADFIM